DTHFLAFEQLGATVTATHRLGFRATKLRGADVFLDEPSVTATENALVAAVAAHGTTYLRNAASEPHVQDLAHFLVALGAKIEGIGTNTIIVHGPATLGGARYSIQPDHIEVGSLIGLAAVTRSPLRIARAGVEHLRSIRMGFERLGIVCGVEGDDLVVPTGQTMKIHDDFGGHVPKLEDQPWPAFPADLMSIAIVTATQCDGVILMFEKMFESRMFFVDKLIAMGGRIVLCDPHRAIVAGPRRLIDLLHDVPRQDRARPGDGSAAEPTRYRADGDDSSLGADGADTARPDRDDDDRPRLHRPARRRSCGRRCARPHRVLDQLH